MATILDDFITRMRWDVDESGLRKAESSAESFKSKMLVAGAAIAGVFAGGALITALAETTTETLRIANATGIAVEEFQVMEGVAKKLGVNIDTLRGQFFNMRAQIAEAQRGGGPLVEEFKHFGIAVNNADGSARDFDEILGDIRTRMQDLTEAEQIDLIDKLSMDEETANFLRVAPEEFERLTGEVRKYGVVTREQSESAKGFIDSLGNIRKATEVLSLTILDKGLKAFAGFINFVAEGIAKLAGNERLLKTIGAVIVGIGVATAAAWVPAAVAVVAAVAPFIAVGAAITALILVVEDLWAYFDGAPSLIGDMVAEFPVLGQVLEFLREAVVGLFDILQDSFQWWMDFFGTMVEQIMSLAGVIGDAFGFLSDVGYSIAGFFGDGDVEINTNGTLAMAPGVASNVHQTADNRNQTVRVDSINVDARGGDSREIASNISGEIRDSMRNAAQDFDSTIAR